MHASQNSRRNSPGGPDAERPRATKNWPHFAHHPRDFGQLSIRQNGWNIVICLGTLGNSADVADRILGSTHRGPGIARLFLASGVGCPRATAKGCAFPGRLMARSRPTAVSRGRVETRVADSTGGLCQCNRRGGRHLPKMQNNRMGRRRVLALGPHRFRLAVEALLNSIQFVFVFPPRDASLLVMGASQLRCTPRTDQRPVLALHLAGLFGTHSVDGDAACRALLPGGPVAHSRQAVAGRLQTRSQVFQSDVDKEKTRP